MQRLRSKLHHSPFRNFSFHTQYTDIMINEKICKYFSMKTSQTFAKLKRRVVRIVGKIKKREVKKKRPVSIQLNPDLIARLKTVAEQHDLAYQRLIEILLLWALDSSAEIDLNKFS